MRVLVLHTKAPRAGLAKTRLAADPRIGIRGAEQLAEAFLRDTLAHCMNVRLASLLVSFTPRDAEGVLRELAPSARLVPQAEDEFGARLAGALAHAFASGATRVVVVGADTPHVSPSLLEQAFDALERSPIVLGPAADGGYWLIGMRTNEAGLFEQIEWSTERVLAQTLRRAAQRGLDVELLPEMFDVDVVEDLERLAREIELDGAARCPHTRAALRALGFTR